MHTLSCHPLPWCSALTSLTFRLKLIESGPLASPPEPASWRQQRERGIRPPGSSRVNNEVRLQLTKLKDIANVIKIEFDFDICIVGAVP